MESTRKVYLDHASTTPIDKRVQSAMLPFIETYFGNPSSFHSAGKVVRDAIIDARNQIALGMGARADELIFTSGGTEADNLAVLGFARKNKKEGNHIISSTVEHPAILESLQQLEREGFDVTYLPVDKDGLIDPDHVIEAIREDTILVSIIFANNEIGTINPIKKIGAKLKKYRDAARSKFPVFHTDACQVVGARAIDVYALDVDMMTINSSKIYGPKGVGALFVKRGIKLQPLQFGGSQEKGKRPGTENVIGIIGFARAFEIANTDQEEENNRISGLRNKLLAGIESRISKTRLNGHRIERLPNNLNISFMDIEGEALLLYMDAKGISASTGSACTSASLDPSHVILALGLPYEVAHGSIRFTLGRSTAEEDINYVLEVLPPLVEKLRKISPVNVDEKYYKI